MKKVLVVVIARLDRDHPVHAKCLASIYSQDYPNVDALIYYKKPTSHDSWAALKNCVDNRNAARKCALASDADYFLFLDDDIALPNTAVSSFMLQTGKKTSTITVATQGGEVIPAGREIPEKHIQSGWYPIFFADTKTIKRFLGGRWVADNRLIAFHRPEASLIKTDVVGCGCAFLSREVLTAIEFEFGIDVAFTDEYGQQVRGEEHVAFGNRAFALGYDMYMNGDVVCEHHKAGFESVYRGTWRVTKIVNAFKSIGSRLSQLRKISTGASGSYPNPAGSWPHKPDLRCRG
jgi:glycosyltransferase involved in cell wall biosynthesis